MDGHFHCRPVIQALRAVPFQWMEYKGLGVTGHARRFGAHRQQDSRKDGFSFTKLLNKTSKESRMQKVSGCSAGV